jgi:bifunctional UDP-N-acetylglucosamine pyrophosphorylase/glucosamine-1-phosphate N-acetyltransferase
MAWIKQGTSTETEVTRWYNKALAQVKRQGQGMSLAVVILAAGKGTRMKSALPKVLHAVAGKPMVQHVVDAAASLNPANIVIVYGHGGEQVKATVTGELAWAEQAEQLGTGHAVAQAMPHVKEDMVLVLYGDVPLIRPETLKDFVASVDDNTLALMTLALNDPNGYGRIVRDGQNNVQRIVEQKDASEAELGIQEINTGILACSRRFLEESLPKLSSNNAQGEYYLTDLIAMASQSGLNVETLQPNEGWEVDGVNDRVQLARLERIFQQAQAETLSTVVIMCWCLLGGAFFPLSAIPSFLIPLSMTTPVSLMKF